MRKAGLFCVTSVLFVMAAGCGGNQAACEDYVDRYNDLECAAQQLSAEQTCPASLDEDDCDMEDYYACLADGTVCEDGQVSEPECSLDCEAD